jgi:hypothetical protein
MAYNISWNCITGVENVARSETVSGEESGARSIVSSGKWRFSSTHFPHTLITAA